MLGFSLAAVPAFLRKASPSKIDAIKPVVIGYVELCSVLSDISRGLSVL